MTMKDFTIPFILLDIFKQRRFPLSVLGWALGEGEGARLGGALTRYQGPGVAGAAQSCAHPALSMRWCVQMMTASYPEFHQICFL